MLRMMIRVILVLTLCLPGRPLAGERSVRIAPRLAGVWSLDAGGQAIFQFKTFKRGESLSAIWRRPTYFEMTGFGFQNLRGPMVERRASSVEPLGSHAFRVAFPDPGPNATPDVFIIDMSTAGAPTLTYVGVPIGPLRLRTSARWTPTRSVETGRIYKIFRPQQTNSELTQIFSADQGERRAYKGGDFTEIAKADAIRRARVRQMINQDLLDSGEDYLHAAFVFQHGSTPEDFLLAHVLANVAMARGNPDAAWLSAASLDRYLQNRGRPQIFGTQRRQVANQETTCDPVDAKFLTERTRLAMNVVLDAGSCSGQSAGATPTP